MKPYYKCIVKTEKVLGVRYILKHTVRINGYENINGVEVFFTKNGVSYSLTFCDKSTVDGSPLPHCVRCEVLLMLNPISIKLGSTLSKRLQKRAKALSELSGSLHVVYGVSRDEKGRLMTFFKPCDTEGLASHKAVEPFGAFYVALNSNALSK